jgi:hypothetical protein
MDPYLESPGFWPDFHHGFITYWRDALSDRLPDQYMALIDEEIRLVFAENGKHIRPDLAILHRPKAKKKAATFTSGAATLEPVTLPLAIPSEVREARIKILHRPKRTLVTVLELLSPTNKIGAGRADYLAKREAVLRQPIHLVELDLLIGGRRLPMARPLPPAHYYALIARKEQRYNAQVYAWTIRQLLPAIPIPLKAPDADLVFDLAAVFALAFERGRYARDLPYQRPPPVPLAREDKAWAAKRGKSVRH